VIEQREAHQHRLEQDLLLPRTPEPWLEFGECRQHAQHIAVR
jgi:hypothetical protein